jgi:hypothetical protein
MIWWNSSGMKRIIYARKTIRKGSDSLKKGNNITSQCCASASYKKTKERLRFCVESVSCPNDIDIGQPLAIAIVIDIETDFQSMNLWKALLKPGWR